MFKLTIGIAVLLTQLTAPGNSLPQIMFANFKSEPVNAGRKADITVAFNVVDGYAITHTPPISLKLAAVPGLKLDKAEYTSSSADPKSKDEYYVDLPTIKVGVVAAKPGKYEIPGQLIYFFCKKTEGYCSRQAFDVKIPLQVQ